MSHRPRLATVALAFTFFIGSALLACSVTLTGCNALAKSSPDYPAAVGMTPEQLATAAAQKAAAASYAKLPKAQQEALAADGAQHVLADAKPLTDAAGPATGGLSSMVMLLLTVALGAYANSKRNELATLSQAVKEVDGKPNISGDLSSYATIPAHQAAIINAVG